MTKQTVPASMTQGPEAKRISDRMTELGLELAKYPFVPHPRARELEEELDRLRPLYKQTLESGK